MYNNSDRVLDEVCENTRHLYRSSRVHRASLKDDIDWAFKQIDNVPEENRYWYIVTHLKKNLEKIMIQNDFSDEAYDVLFDYKEKFKNDSFMLKAVEQLIQYFIGIESNYYFSKKSSRVHRASIFDEEWNAITKDKIFEFYNTETGEYEYDYVRYDGKTLSWMDCSVEVDHDYGADHNLQALGDVIMEKHPEFE